MNTTSSVRSYAVVNLIALVIMLTINVLANSIPINGYTTGEISAMYPNLFTPAGWAFSIWGLIYLALIVLVVVQLRFAWRADHGGNRSAVLALWPWFAINGVANAAWIFAWHHQRVWISLLLMIVILWTLIRMYLALRREERFVSSVEKWTVWHPVSLYLGWITIATIANVTIYLVDLDWNAFGIDPRFWTLFIIWAGVLIAVTVIRRHRDVIYGLVILWAFAAILVKRLGEGAIWSDVIPLGVLLGMVYIAFTIITAARNPVRE